MRGLRTSSTPLFAAQSSCSPAGGMRSARLGRVLAAGALLALAALAALSVRNDPAHAAFPGANGRIACEGNRAPTPTPAPSGFNAAEIITVEPDGSGERLLTNNTVLDRDPRYSPDGRKIAFASTRDGNTEIYTMNADGTDVRRLTFNAGTGVGTGGLAATDQQPSWSPDGREIVFHSGRFADFPDGRFQDFEIYKMSATGGEGASLTRLTHTRGQDAIPEWSPDGSKIAFQTLREGLTPARNNNLEIYTMNPDGSDQRNVSNSPGTPNNPATTANENSNAIDSFPSWSPDGRQIAFGSTRDSVTPSVQNFEIYRMNRDGSAQTRLTLNRSGDTPGADTDYDHVPSWSPDGRRIIFHSARENQLMTAFTMDSATGEATGLQRLTRTNIFGRCDWQPIRGVPRLAATVCPTPRIGSESPDILNGTPGGDRMFGLGGRDIMNGVQGADCLFGGEDGDSLAGSTGRDLLQGDAGNDTLKGGSSADRLSGGTGRDRVLGAAGNDRLYGGSGNDSIDGGRGTNRYSAGSGNDKVNAANGRRERVNCGSGRRDVVRADRSDRLRGCERRRRVR